MTILFEISDEMKDMVSNLVKNRSDIFNYIETDIIECALRIDKPAPASQKNALKIKGIRGVDTLLTEKRYVIYGYASSWNALPDEKKYAYLANMLIRVDAASPEEIKTLAEDGKEFEWGKLRKPDMNDFKNFVRALGIDWNEDGVVLGNIVKDKTIKIEV